MSNPLTSHTQECFGHEVQIMQTYPTCVDIQPFLRMGAVSKSRPLGHRALIPCQEPMNLKA